MHPRAIDRLRRALPRRPKRRTPPGAPPGMLMPDPMASPPRLSVIAFGPDGLIEKPEATLADAEALREYPVVWVNVDGLGDVEVIRAIGKQFGLHALALEDVVNTHQRPKVESYADHLFLVVRDMTLNDRLEVDQISLFLGERFVVSFQEKPGDHFDAVRSRLRAPGTRLRTSGADYLAYALLDAVLDSYFPVIEALGERIDEIEDRVLTCPRADEIARLHAIRRELLMLRRAVWPLRETLNAIVRDQHPLIRDETRMFLRDTADHAVQIIDLVEMDRELCADLRDVHLTAVNNRLGQVMKVLTIISTIFIPLTFLAGVYGMNFDTSMGNMPELLTPWGYAAFWGVSGVIAFSLLGLFWRLGWMRPSA